MDLKALGKRGEVLAIEYLIQKGYRVLTKNYRNRLGEVDVIAYDPNYDETVFVEVKTRRTQTYGSPEEAVHGLKLHTIAKVAECYLDDISVPNSDWRVDVISISIHDADTHIEHLENVGEN